MSRNSLVSLCSLAMFALTTAADAKDYSSYAGYGLCPQVKILKSDGKTVFYKYYYGQATCTDNSDDKLWVGKGCWKAPVPPLTDFKDVAVLDTLHIKDESESAGGGKAANWKVKVWPMAVPTTCLASKSYSAREKCIAKLSGGWKGAAFKLSSGPANISMSVPGPYDTGDICEFAKIESLGKQQHVKYAGLGCVLYDWSVSCF